MPRLPSMSVYRCDNEECEGVIDRASSDIPFQWSALNATGIKDHQKSQCPSCGVSGTKVDPAEVVTSYRGGVT